MNSDPHNTDTPETPPPDRDLSSLESVHGFLLNLKTEIAAWAGWIERALDNTGDAAERGAAPFAAARAARAAERLIDTFDRGTLGEAVSITKTACQVPDAATAADIHGPGDLGPPSVKPGVESEVE